MMAILVPFFSFLYITSSIYYMRKTAFLPNLADFEKDRKLALHAKEIDCTPILFPFLH